MKPIIKFSITVLLCFIFAGSIFAQDKILKRNGEVIECKIKEVTTDEVKYLKKEVAEDVIFAIDKNLVEKVAFSNGEIMTFELSMEVPVSIEKQKKNLIKIRLLSPLYGYTDLIYERSIKPGRSIEGALGIIGLGVDQMELKPRGASIRFGYKFMQKPDYYIKGMKYAHVLKGFYVRPELAISIFQMDEDRWLDWGYEESYTRRRLDHFAIAGIINVGKQWIFGDFMALDWFVGIGYGYRTNNEELVWQHYGFSVFDNDTPVAFSTGFRVGILL